MEKKQGMYDPQFEHAVCGITILANIKGDKSDAIAVQTLTLLEGFAHIGRRRADAGLVWAIQKGKDAAMIFNEPTLSRMALLFWRNGYVN
ncbi:hypothetical protein FQ087_05815 [Sporosarcina sp. ANT_H38]|uniref:hypothetical protein n=1 Tax=Sporosarcina sp. ANT_H38 TaxID=2597358 RepID=UPI0011F19351|nr:hypothetical protein [Sporosarcina sp. ANT_H38]KAA0965790.1 hypothetical protein FQ087_05815 [Sporosarcina sp. ANT_H38]